MRAYSNRRVPQLRTAPPFPNWLVTMVVPALVLLALPGWCAPAYEHEHETTPAEWSDEFAAIYRQADEHFHDGEYWEVIRCHRRLIAMDPTFIESYTNAAWLLWSLERESAALALLKRGCERNPEASQLHFDLGFYHFQGGRYALAAENFQRAADAGCQPTFRHMLAHALERSGNLTGSLREWEALQKLEPDSPVVSRQLARVKKLIELEEQASPEG